MIVFLPSFQGECSVMVSEMLSYVYTVRQAGKVRFILIFTVTCLGHKASPAVGHGSLYPLNFS